MSVSYANGTSTSYTYSNSGRLTQLSNATATQPSTYGYSYDLVGNRTGMLVNETEPHVYTYDHIYQLTDVNYPVGYFQTDTGFTYDPAGNRSGVSNPSTTYLTNTLNQYTFVGSDGFSYDNNGNLTGDGHSSYTYDAENQLITANANGQTIQYTYDAAGRRVRKTVAGQVTQYVYDGSQVIGEYNGEGTLLRRFIYGPGLDEPICLHTRDQVGDLTGDARVDLDDLLALAGQWLLTDADPEYDPLYDLTQDGKIDNADVDVLSAHWRELTGSGPVQVFYYHFDGLGSVVALSDAAGDVVATYAYDVYGRSQPAGATHGNPYRFTARRWDGETGLYYYRARYYHPTIGRFLQPDPIGYADGLNWYTYCGNSPIILVDPWGLCYKPTAWEWGGAVAGGIGEGLYNTYIDPFVAAYDYYGVFRSSGMGVASSGLQAVNMGVGKAVGYGTIMEGVVGVDARSVRELSGGQRAWNVGLGTAQVALTVGGAHLAGKTPKSPKLTGQQHHGISTKVHRAAETRPNLAGKYQARDPRFVAQAKDLASHNGYQKWHRELDDEIVGWIKKNPDATPAQFEAFLGKRYSQPDLASRFPNGLGGG